MSNGVRRWRDNRSQALLLALCIALAGGIGVAAEAQVTGEVASVATQAPGIELLELDEVWVRGKSLTRTIEDAENAFFVRYNQLNENDNYDVHCGDIAIHRGSMIMTRTCLPGFIADRSYARTVPTAGMYYRPPAFNATPMCHGRISTEGGAVYFEGGCDGVPADQSYYNGTTYAGYYSARTAAPIMQGQQMYGAPLELEAMHRRQEYADTVIKVIHGDPQLVEMAEGLSRLYAELELIQHRYRAVREERFMARPPNYGPRVRAPRAR